ncbi:Endo-1,4-beta-xylanase A precursor [Paenibacillus xylanexedens]|nr:Endo-1,4-beta-xylanase A precursor [Paenibacillus xylanexedens]
MLFDSALKAKKAYWGLVDESCLPVLTQRAVSLSGKPDIRLNCPFHGVVSEPVQNMKPDWISV